ncbi:hypothetical protein AXX17_ATUG01090 [Arabidopsis thaliana]|uniref:Uncharacterized protein n=1 Tax=Arabidopsis thaliana TaxID=3702 RepID=A0A178U709_ARATH|nr:hypothetical protein AXX17_ATUG01090 [Arabidopsis thaliana]
MLDLSCGVAILLETGVDFGAGLNMMVKEFFRRLHVTFRHDENASVHLSKQHFLWYGNDRKGLMASVFVPLCGCLLQAQGQYPGDMRYCFSRKSKQET